MKKILSVVLVAFASTLALNAATETVDGIVWEYEISGASVIVTGATKANGTKVTGSIGVPATLGGKQVTRISPVNADYYGGAFRDCTGLQSITIPSTVTSIGAYSFDGCTGLRSITMPSALSQIGAYAFRNCKGLTNISIPAGVTEIPEYAFANCESLSGVLLPSVITAIGQYAFAECSSLTEFQIPAGVPEIAGSTFFGCAGLRDITIPNGVWSIGSSAFAGCTGLTNATIGANVIYIGTYAFGPATSASNIEAKHLGDTCENLVSMTFLGDAPTIESTWSENDSIHSVAPSFCIYVGRLAGGWGVSIPGMWKGYPIEYRDEHNSDPDPTLDDLTPQPDSTADISNVTPNTSAQTNALYCVIDLSGGRNAAAFPVSYLDEVPTGGWTDEYKTSKLVLRRIEPGSFMMCGSYHVTLTKPYYIGVFEVTRKQYELVMGDVPGYSPGDMRPVDGIEYFMLRGSTLDGADWPASSMVYSESFMGILRAKTGMSGFDLPTEAQWEYSCRAGTTSLFNNGGSSENDLKLLGRYLGNHQDGKGGYTGMTTVGSYLPNAWGLYDMHGNAWEWCLDRYGDLSDGAVDPAGPEMGSARVLRGGSANFAPEYCTSSYRLNRTYTYCLGFRVACMTPVPTSCMTPVPTFSIVNGVLLNVDPDGVKEIVIPDGVTNIAANAFSGCEGLERIVIPDSVTSIDHTAFDKCGKLWANWYKTLANGAAEATSATIPTELSLTVTNVVVHYVTQSVQSGAVTPPETTGLVNVIAEVASGGPVAIASTWAEQYQGFSTKFGNDFTAALTKPTGKRDGAGNEMFVWQDFVSGTDPTDPDDRFTASITFDEQGKPVISYSPELSAAEAAKRTYRKFGKVRLNEANWTEIYDDEEANYNFFKVTVEMK